MAGANVDLTRVADLLAALRDAGVPCSLEAGDLNLPGALVNVQGFGFDVLRGFHIKATVLLVVPDTGPVRSLQALTSLFNLATVALTPDADVTVRTTTLAESPAPLPALEVPVNLYA
jgi:hypothetical protein